MKVFWWTKSMGGVSILMTADMSENCGAQQRSVYEVEDLIKEGCFEISEQTAIELGFH